jgi:hypothetical protein
LAPCQETEPVESEAGQPVVCWRPAASAAMSVVARQWADRLPRPARHLSAKPLGRQKTGESTDYRPSPGSCSRSRTTVASWDCQCRAIPAMSRRQCLALGQQGSGWQSLRAPGRQEPAGQLTQPEREVARPLPPYLDPRCWRPARIPSKHRSWHWVRLAVAPPKVHEDLHLPSPMRRPAQCSVREPAAGERSADHLHPHPPGSLIDPPSQDAKACHRLAIRHVHRADADQAVPVYLRAKVADPPVWRPQTWPSHERHRSSLCTLAARVSG